MRELYQDTKDNLLHSEVEKRRVAVASSATREHVADKRTCYS